MEFEKGASYTICSAGSGINIFFSGAIMSEDAEFITIFDDKDNKETIVAKSRIIWIKEGK